MKYYISLLILILSVCAFSQNTDYSFNSNLSPIKYGIAYWEKNGHGNHRAVVEVSSPAAAVLAHIDWRRHDKTPQLKGIIVENEKGEKVNSVAFNVTDPSGDIVFEAKTQGKYYIYYMPYYETYAYFIEETEYLNPLCKADKAWLSENKLDIHSPDLYVLPKAKQIEIQSKSDFDSFYPMEVPIYENEINELTANVKTPYMVFAEDRLYQIRMKDKIPYKWYKSGEVTDFTGYAQPNEIYTFQIGLYALNDINNVTLDISDFGSVKSGDIHCINTNGKDYLGKPFTKTINVKKGFVQPLWFYVQMPKDAKGWYKGTVTIKSDNNPDRVVNVNIGIKGDYLVDGGVSDLWRMSRLSWLDSDLAINDNPVAPYTPIKVSGNKASVLNRDYYFNDLGFPSKLVANKKNLLNSPMEFNVYSNKKVLTFKKKSSKVLVKNKGAYEFENISSCEDLDLKVHGRLEFDGVLEYKVSLKANRDITLDKVDLDTVMNNAFAKYSMGLGMRGGIAPNFYYWEWNPNRVDYLVWVGDYNAGMQIALKASDDGYRSGGFVNKSVFNPGFYNDDKGYGTLKRDGKDYILNFTSGEKSFKSGEECTYNFRVTLTPFRDLDPKYYTYRVGGPDQPNTNIYHLHHATGPNPYINYPFAKYDELKSFTEKIKNIPVGDPVKIIYNTNDIRSDEGSVSLKLSTKRNWTEYALNTGLMNIYFGKKYFFNLYWNQDVRTLRFVLFNNEGETPAVLNSFDTSISPDSWKAGEKHEITLTWGDTIKVYCDRECVGSCAYKLEDIPKGSIELSNDYSYYLVKGTLAEYNSGLDIKDDSDAVLFDDFSDVKKGSAIGQKLECNKKFTSVKNGEDYELKIDDNIITKDWDINLYYTCRELSDHCYEIWALRSLGDEIYDTETLMYTGEGAKLITGDGGGHQWLNEHLETGYVPGWYCNLGTDDCAAIATKYVSRWMNYYVKGMDYIMKTLGIHGLYLDGIGYDRETMKRIARVMEANSSDYRINFHAGNNYDYLNAKANTYNTCMEHLAYINSLWTGEMFDFDNTKPDYWFVEMSGIPFGLRNEILDYKTGGNPWRAMVFNMHGRSMKGNVGFFDMWDNYDFAGRKMVGYWDDKPLAKTSNPDIYATCYAKKNSVILALGSWTQEDNVKVDFDFKSAGINPDKCSIKTVNIPGLQKEGDDVSLDSINIPLNGGIVIEIKNL